MKIIHFADLHIGSKFERMPEKIKLDLNTKLRNAFMNIINYAKSNSITTILMSGDIFDKDSVLMADKKFFYDSIRINPEIDFYYIRGNHDLNSKYNDEIENLHTFNGVQTYVKDDVRIIGYELNDKNEELYNHVSFSTDKYNILMLHGDVNNSRDNNYIDLKKLQGKNVNYCALGHIHRKWSGSVGDLKCEYPGCVLGRGFDETGDKGFLVLDTETSKTAFCKLSTILFEQIEIQVNEANEAQLKMDITNKLESEKKNVITEIRLTGKSDMVIDEDDIIRSFETYRYYLTLKNNAKQALNYNINENENSLKNMFINKVLKDTTIDDDTKEKVITYGLSRLMKEEC